MSAQWPSAVVSTSQLYVAVNELQNNLSGAINAAVTTIGLNSTTSFPTVGLVLIDNEVIQYTGISGNNLTGCTRAFDGTSAATHSSGATVSFAFCAAHYNNAANEVIAVESYLNTVLGKSTTVLAAEFAYLSGVTSAIQTQLNAKAPSASPTFTGTITTPLTASRAVTVNGSSQFAVSTCTAAELDFVHGVTSAIQTQLNATIANPLTSNLAAGGFKLTGLAAGSTNGDSVRYEQITSLAPINEPLFTGNIRNQQALTMSSSVDVQPATPAAASVYVMREVSNGGCALVLIEHLSTPIIISQAGNTTFVTGAPGATQIQIKEGSPYGIAFRAGSSRNGATLNLMTLTPQES